MESDVKNTELMLLANFAKMIGATKDTMYRWMTRGVKHPIFPDRDRIYLKLTRMPGGWGLTRADYDKFISELNPKP